MRLGEQLIFLVIIYMTLNNEKTDKHSQNRISHKELRDSCVSTQKAEKVLKTINLFRYLFFSDVMHSPARPSSNRTGHKINNSTRKQIELIKQKIEIKNKRKI